MPYFRYEFSPAALENMRYRVEETDEPLQSIADSHGISRPTLSDRAAQRGWKSRSRSTKRDLPPGQDLHAIADAALRALAANKVAKRLRASEPNTAQAGTGAETLDDASNGAQAGAETAEAASNAEAASTAERVERLLIEQLSAVEARRLAGTPSVTATERMTRVLERLTEALFKVRRLRASEPDIAGPDDYDDWPADMDAFRNELARRIDAFVEAQDERAVSRSGGGEAGAVPGA